MDELDFLKKDWKRQEADLPKVSVDTIYKMIHKRSSSLMKWILYVSIFEFVLWTILNITTVNAETLETLRQIHLYEFEIVGIVLQYAVLGIFIYLFYKNYREVQTTDNTKHLMSRILKVRRTVNFYVAYNLIIFFIIGMVVFIAMLNFDPKFNDVMIQAEDGTQSMPLGFIAVFIVMLLVLVALLWAFYKLLYGILLRRLKRNYKELSKLEMRD
ncbi:MULTISPECIES: hypothetical protein [Leeuwenhoekiella]|uniref:Uncharacterized protein n=1 Tax=Leeuwenhoekiella palythoae TaxID=573501 RepID=A0A1M5SJT2_9FLAO|nr:MULTISPECIES: hypothetical protein [Leeuwenhoekiella]MAS20493.1 hypothetical protein [Leeuwenhoekiella sp.]MEC7784922.1 hypothetical protein [Bacteroidota bacterium]MEC8682564.1 hypothetical protein [Bacteroidota bacterium]MEC8883266.1 hypothetical protein [Bacteroidota bacterium]MEE3147641.1 hypothetical protein [Bacteroidota bacterium]|tara:strand:+ start:5163 stop:5804 length:642 start_codon:yes stop_codon:yes gene_type:complete